MKKTINKAVLAIEDEGIRSFNKWAKDNTAQLYLTIGEPHKQTPDLIKAACCDALKNNKTFYSDSRGELALRAAIKHYEAKKYHLEYQTDDIIVTAGSTLALAITLKTLLNPGDEVLVPIPTYPLYEKLIKLYGARFIPFTNKEYDYQMPLSLLTKHLSNKTKALIITMPNNPTGIIFDNESLERIKHFILTNQLYLIIDATYWELAYNTKPLLTIFDEIKEQLIIIKSFSKPYAMTGWRLGYLLCPSKLSKYLNIVNQNMLVAPNTFIQYAGIKALELDTCSFIKDYHTNRDYAFSELNAMGLHCLLPQGAFYLFFDISPYHMTSLEFCEQLVIKQKLALTPGRYFYDDTRVRLSFCVELDILQQALFKLKAFIDGLKIA